MFVMLHEAASGKCDIFILIKLRREGCHHNWTSCNTANDLFGHIIETELNLVAAYFGCSGLSTMCSKSFERCH